MKAGSRSRRSLSATAPRRCGPTIACKARRAPRFHAYLDLTAAELIIRKGFRKHIDSYSAFFENDRKTPTGLAGYLRDRGLRRIFLAGLATDYCVAYSALDARTAGFESVVVIDACRAIDLDGSLARMTAEMTKAGVGIVESAALS